MLNKYCFNVIAFSAFLLNVFLKTFLSLHDYKTTNADYYGYGMVLWYGIMVILWYLCSEEEYFFLWHKSTTRYNISRSECFFE